MQIVLPHYKAVCEKLDLPEGQKMVLQLDMYRVHTSAAYRDWLKEKYDFILLVYVPGGTTSKAQVLPFSDAYKLDRC